MSWIFFERLWLCSSMCSNTISRCLLYVAARFFSVANCCDNSWILSCSFCKHHNSCHAPCSRLDMALLFKLAYTCNMSRKQRVSQHWWTAKEIYVLVPPLAVSRLPLFPSKALIRFYSIRLGVKQIYVLCCSMTLF